MTPRSLLFPLGVLVFCGMAASWSTSSRDEKVPTEPIHLHGAGATFPAPLYEQWLAAYQKRHPEVRLRYDAVGSGAGAAQFLAAAVDFRASDAALTDTEMAHVPRGVQLLPVVAGSIVLAYHLPGVTGNLKLTREVYTDIFLGKVTRWDDKRPDNLRAFFPDPDGIYPKKVAALKQFVNWCLTDGQALSEPLGYVRLAPSVVTRAMAALAQMQ